jgi:fatty-acyl-CoA synthase
VIALEAAEARGEPYDLSSLQRIHNSGAMFSAVLKDALLARGTMHIYDSLGASEGVGFGFALTTAPHQSTTARFRLGPNARLLAAADRDEDVAVGSRQPGVLAVHTSCAIGYHDDPDATAATFRVIGGRLHAIPGDHAILDDDGTLTLLGRGHHCINTGGEKVWPEEIEEALKTHPAVVDAAVVGVSDPEWGQIVGAVVEVSGVPPAPDELAEWVGRHLADYKRPRRITYAEVKRTAIGKPDYRWAEACLASH